MRNKIHEGNPDLMESSYTIIRPKSGWQLEDFRELFKYSDLFFSLVWRDIKVLYAQTILGFAWAIIQPLTQILIFTMIFGRVAKISSDGIPYFLFSTVSVIPWTFISRTIVQSSQSLVAGQQMLGKVYFPRLLFPLTPVFSKLVDFFISLSIVIVALFYYRIPPSINLLFLPLFILLMISISSGAGLWLSSMAIRFRDVKYITTFATQMLMYSAPIVYSASAVPEKWRLFYSLNPIVGVIEGFRACLVGNEILWQYILPGIVTNILFLVGGAFYFKHMERVFVDVI